MKAEKAFCSLFQMIITALLVKSKKSINFREVVAEVKKAMDERGFGVASAP